MSYGLYISDGVNGGVITNSNNIFNEEIFASQAGTMTSNSSISLNIPDIDDAALMAYNIDEDNDTESISVTTSSDTLTLSNSTVGDVPYYLSIFRFR